MDLRVQQGLRTCYPSVTPPFLLLSSCMSYSMKSGYPHWLSLFTTHFFDQWNHFPNCLSLIRNQSLTATGSALSSGSYWCDPAVLLTVWCHIFHCRKGLATRGAPSTVLLRVSWSKVGMHAFDHYALSGGYVSLAIYSGRTRLMTFSIQTYCTRM